MAFCRDDDNDIFELFNYFPQDIYLKKQYRQSQNWSNDILDEYDYYIEFYEDCFDKIISELDDLQLLLFKIYKRDKDIKWFISHILKFIQIFDEYPLEIIGDEYYPKIADIIIEALNLAPAETKEKVLKDIQKGYLNPRNKDMYSYTMSIVLDTLLGRRKFNILYQKRLILELENFDLNDYSREFNQEELERINKELNIK